MAFASMSSASRDESLMNPIPPIDHRAGTCLRCGYDLRGIMSLQCPECGTPRSVPIAISDARQYHRARAALEHDGLLIKFIDPGGQLGTMGTLYGLLPG